MTSAEFQNVVAATYLKARSQGADGMTAMCTALAIWMSEKEKNEMTRLLCEVVYVDKTPFLTPADMLSLALTACQNVPEEPA